MSIHMLPQAKHADIQNIFFEELQGSFTTNILFWQGYPEGRCTNFMEMLSSLDLVLHYGRDTPEKNDVITHFTAVYQNGGISYQEHGKLCQIGEIFFRGFQKSPLSQEYVSTQKINGEYGFPTSKRLINELAGLAKDEKADLETRIAAYNLVKAVQRPELKDYCEKVQLPEDEDFKKTEVSVEPFPEGYFLPPEPPPIKSKGLTPKELGIAAQNYHIKKGPCHIDYGDKKVNLIFDELDNWFSPNFIYGYIGGKWEAFPMKGALSIDITTYSSM